MKNNIKILYQSILVIIFGISCAIMSLVHYSGSVWGTKEENYLDPINWKTGVFFVLGTIAGFTFLKLWDFVLQKTEYSNRAYIKNKKKFVLIIAMTIVIAWIPYFLSYYPGGVYSDTFDAVSMALGEKAINNSQPVLYTLLLQGAIYISYNMGGDLTFALGICLAIQMIMVEILIVYFLYWLVNHKINKIIIICCAIYLIFFPLIPLNAISIWKDTPFSVSIICYVLNLTDLYLKRKQGENNYGLMIGCAFWGVIVILMRNNGIYIIIGTVVAYIFALLKQCGNKKKQFITCLFLLSSVIIAFIIEGPVYKRLGVTEKNNTAYLGIPLQQIGRVVAYEGDITEKQKEQIDKFMPYEIMKEKYVPCLTDSIKWDNSFDQVYLNGHMSEFFELWWELFLQNPKEYVKAYIMNTAGFWCLNVSGFDAYVQTFVWDNGRGVEQIDYFQKFFGVSFQELVNPKYTISSAWYIWLLLFSVVICIKRTGIKGIVAYMPLLGVWITLMIATPIAVSMRYVQSLIFAAPLCFVFPIILQKDNLLERKG